jgi:hypothetical protein
MRPSCDPVATLAISTMSASVSGVAMRTSAFTAW